MISAKDYIKLILQKKKWTNRKLCQELNKLELQLGDKRTTVQNITNYLNGYHDIRPKWLAKVEVALELEQGTLVNMVTPPNSKDGKKELEAIMKKVREVKNVKERNISKN